MRQKSRCWPGWAFVQKHWDSITSKLSQLVDSIKFLFVRRLKTPFPRWLLRGGHSQLPEATGFPCQVLAPFIFRASHGTSSLAESLSAFHCLTSLCLTLDTDLQDQRIGNLNYITNAFTATPKLVFAWVTGREGGCKPRAGNSACLFRILQTILVTCAATNIFWLRSLLSSLLP